MMDCLTFQYSVKVKLYILYHFFIIHMHRDGYKVPVCIEKATIWVNHFPNIATCDDDYC